MTGIYESWFANTCTTPGRKHSRGRVSAAKFNSKDERVRRRYLRRYRRLPNQAIMDHIRFKQDDFGTTARVFRCVSFNNCDFSDVDLSGQNFNQCSFKDAKFVRTKIDRAAFNNCVMLGVNALHTSAVAARFRFSSISRAMMNESNFSGATFDECDLFDTHFVNANLTGVSFHRCKLGMNGFTGANMENAKLDFSAWPLWCGTLNAKVGEDLLAQLLYHVLSIDHGRIPGLRKETIEWANRCACVDTHGLQYIPTSHKERSLDRKDWSTGYGRGADDDYDEEEDEDDY